MASRVLIAGIGNELMGDDGLGTHMVRLLRSRYDFPPGVEILDVGTAGFDLVDHLAGRAAVVLIDALQLDGMQAGTVVRFSKSELTGAPNPARISPHQPSLRETILAADLLGAGVAEIVLIGVAAGSFEMGEGLSGPVLQALPALEAHLIAELEKLGASLRPRASELLQ